MSKKVYQLQVRSSRFRKFNRILASYSYAPVTVSDSERKSLKRCYLKDKDFLVFFVYFKTCYFCEIGTLLKGYYIKFHFQEFIVLVQNRILCLV